MRASEFPVLFNFSFFESLWLEVEYDTIKRNGGNKVIVGDINYLENYKNQLPEDLYICLDAMRGFPFEQVEDGKYIVWHCAMSVESPMTELTENRKLEGHKEFIDVVYEVDVEEEWIGYRPVKEGKEVERNQDKDLYFYEAKGEETKVHMRTGMFLICYPEDLHRPLCCGKSGPKRIRKAVLKFPVVKNKEESFI